MAFLYIQKTKFVGNYDSVAMPMESELRNQIVARKENEMTRQDVKDMMIALGIAEPTNDQIDTFLNKHNADVQREKDLANRYKSDAQKVAELQAKLDELNAQNMSDIEKAQLETQKSNDRVADLERQIAIMQRKNALAEKGIVGEQADKLFGADGSLDIEMLGQIISERETNAKAQAEKDLLNKTPNPNGANGSNGNEKTAEDLLVDSIANSMANTNKGAADIVANYL